MRPGLLLNTHTKKIVSSIKYQVSSIKYQDVRYSMFDFGAGFRSPVSIIHYPLATSNPY
jgi:hypothetical protein